MMKAAYMRKRVSRFFKDLSAAMAGDTPRLADALRQRAR